MRHIRAAATIIFLTIVGVGLFALRRHIDATDRNTVSSKEFSSTKSGAAFRVGEKAPDFSAVDFDGVPIRLSDFTGKPIVLDFWAAWCPFCIEELPSLEAVHQETAGKVVFWGIHRTDSGESIERAKMFADDKGVTYTLVRDATGEIYKMAAGGINVMPIAVFIGSDGIVTDIKLGPKTQDEIREKVRSLL